MPGPTEIPPVDVVFRPVVASTNPLGAKGVGEIGMIAAPAALYAAIKDAVGGPDVDLALPCTPERVWHALRGGRGG
jgi:carbon-monoxide dehydrogenase large subunit